jgi:hypothetical protein
MKNKTVPNSLIDEELKIVEGCIYGNSVRKNLSSFHWTNNKDRTKLNGFLF